MKLSNDGQNLITDKGEILAICKNGDTARALAKTFNEMFSFVGKLERGKAPIKGYRNSCLETINSLKVA